MAADATTKRSGGIIPAMGRLFTLASAASPVLCAAVCVLWVRSYWRESVLAYASRPDRDFGLHSRHGGLTARYSRLGKVHDACWRVLDEPASPYGTVMIDFGDDGLLGWNFTAQLGGRPYWHLRIPYWFAATATAYVAVRPALIRHLRRRAATGLCPACGYDLRATPDRCPECGLPTKVGDS